LSIAEAPALTDEERLIQLEWFELGEFLQMWPKNRGNPHFFRNPGRSHAAIPVFIPTMIHSSAPVYRSAVMLFMSYARNQPELVQRRYFSTYLEAARRCISQGAIPELIYASYLVAGYSLIGGESIKEAIHKAEMFTQGALILIRNESMEDDELWWIETLWQNLLMALYYIHHETVVRNGATGGKDSVDSFQQLDRLFDYCVSFLPSNGDIANLPLGMPSAAICVKVTSLSIYLQFYFDYFLFIQSLRNETISKQAERVQESLVSILTRICQLISHLPNIPDAIYESYRYVKGSDLAGSLIESSHQITNIKLRGMVSAPHPLISDAALTLLYCFCRFLCNHLDPSAPFDTTVQHDVSRSAIAICRVCSTLKSGEIKPAKTVGMLIKRSLFWAGLLTKSGPLGKGKINCSICLIHLVKGWIIQHLNAHLHSDFHWRLSFLGEEGLVERFFLHTEFSSSNDDIWAASAVDVSLFQYALTLAPTFCGLFSAQFDVHSDGNRTIRIV
jgi:hypothetical protein